MAVIAASGIAYPYCGPFEDTNGNLYVVVRETSGFNTAVWKSTDSGATWAESDNAGQPAVPTLVGSFNQAFQDGDTLHIVHSERYDSMGAFTNYDYRTFRMSDHASPDTWNLNENVATITGNAYIHGIAVRSDGSVLISGVGEPASVMGTTYTRVSYWIRSTGGTWGSETAIDDGGSSNYFSGNSETAANKIVTDTSGVEYFLYGRTTLTGLFYKTLTSGTLSSALTITTAGTMFDSEWVYYRTGSTDRLVVMFERSSQSYSHTIDNGTVGAQTQITTENILRFTAAVFGTTAYFIYGDPSNNIDYISSADGAAWGGNTQLAATPEYFMGALAISGGVGVLYGGTGDANYELIALGATTETVTHTLSAILVKTEIVEHTISALLKATEIVEHTVSAILRATVSLTATLSAHKKVTTTEAHVTLSDATDPAVDTGHVMRIRTGDSI